MPLLAEFRALDRRVWWLAATRLVVTAGFSMVLPFLAIHLTAERKQPVAAVVVGLIWTIAGACGAATQWLAGELADRVGRRAVLLGGMVVRAANLALLGWAISVEAEVFWIGALIVGNSMLRSFFDPVANALVADLVPPEQRVACFSLQRVGINIGWAAGPAIVAITPGVSYGTLFFVSAPVTLLAAVVIARLEEPACVTAPRPPSWHELFAFRGDRAFVRFLLATLAFFLLQVQLYQSLSIYAAKVLHLDRGQVGTFYTLNGVLVVLLQLPAVTFIRRVGTRGALFIGCLGYAAAYASVGVAQGHGTMLLCVAGVTLAEIITQPAQQATATTMAPPGRVGAYSGLYGLCQVAGQSAGPLIGTAVLDAVPPRVAWPVLALFGVAAAAMYRSAVRAEARSR